MIESAYRSRRRAPSRCTSTETGSTRRGCSPRRRQRHGHAAGSRRGHGRIRGRAPSSSTIPRSKVSRAGSWLVSSSVISRGSSPVPVGRRRTTSWRLHVPSRARLGNLLTTATSCPLTGIVDQGDRECPTLTAGTGFESASTTSASEQEIGDVRNSPQELDAPLFLAEEERFELPVGYPTAVFNEVRSRPLASTESDPASNPWRMRSRSTRHRTMTDTRSGVALEIGVMPHYRRRTHAAKPHRASTA